MAEKSRDAFRTISEVAEWLDVPTHVLRFWESRFSQIKPVKRAGGRRYYRPSDMRVIGGVKVLLHDQGMTIRGVQKLFREEGVKHVSAYAPHLFGEDVTEDMAVLNETALEEAAKPAAPARSTRDATPDPDEVVEPPVEESLAPDADEAVEPPAEESSAPDTELVFRRSRPRSRIVAEDPPAPDPTPAEPVPAEPAPVEAAPVIPATPDVPETDPDDSDPDHVVAPGLAARLKAIEAQHLAAHREQLVDVRDRLQALLDKAG